MNDVQIRIGILTASDRCYNGITRDTSGELLESMLNDGLIKNAKVVVRMCVADEFEQIKVVLLKWSDVDHLDCILTTGGTGLSPRDITPEVTRHVISKEAFGISSAILFHSLKSTSFAMLSRPVSGVRKQTLIINLPGSAKACVECLRIVADVIPHAVHIIKDHKPKIEQVHMRQLTQDQADLRVDDDCSTAQNHVDKSEDISKVDISKVAHRHRVSPYPLISVKDAQKLILEETSMQHRLRNIHINDALGYILYGEVIAEDAVPPFTASMKDGYAVISQDHIGKRRVSNSSILGNKPIQQMLKSGECVRVTTGAPVPPGADAVVQVEDTTLVTETNEGANELEVEIKSIPKPGQDIRHAGSDIQEGQTILHHGTYLRAIELGLLASVGHVSVSVFEKPSVTILSTGNELQVPEENLQDGKVRDSNKITLVNLLKENGFNASDGGIMPDDPNVMLTMLKRALHKSEVVITTGSASMGERDILADVLIKDFGAIVHFGRVNMKPGKPTKFLTLRYEEELKYVFVLPGNPVSAFVTAHVFVLPALKSLSGNQRPLPKLVKAKIPDEIELDERFEFQRANLDWVGVDVIPTAVPIDNQVSSRLLNASVANCLIYLPGATDGTKKLRPGNIIDVQLIAPL